MAKQKIAPNFAREFNALIDEEIKHRGKNSLRWLAKNVGVNSGVLHHLCKTGTGSEDSICDVFDFIGLKRRRALEMLADRRSELSQKKAKKYWKRFRYAFPNDRQYMTELSPLPIERAFACSFAGISINEAMKSADDAGIKNINDLEKLNSWKLLALMGKFVEKFGSAKSKIVLSEKIEKDIPPVLALDNFQLLNAGDYLPLDKCRGSLLFGIPHIIFGHYIFLENGKIGRHPNTGGVEFLYSLNGTFELTYGGKTYPTVLTNSGMIFVYSGKRKHSIKLIEGKGGELIMVRYYSRRRILKPGPKLDEIREMNKESQQL